MFLFVPAGSVTSAGRCSTIVRFVRNLAMTGKSEAVRFRILKDFFRERQDCARAMLPAQGH